jgi:hypothetical protein
MTRDSAITSRRQIGISSLESVGCEDSTEAAPGTRPNAT